MHIIFTRTKNQQKEKERNRLVFLVLALFLLILFVNIYQQAITGFLVVQGRFTIESFIYSNYSSQSDFYIGRGQSVDLSSLWITNNSQLDYAWLSTNETGTWVNHTIYSSPLKLSGLTGWANFTWQNTSITTTFGWKIYANNTNHRDNVTSEGLIVVVYGVTLPEGIYYIEPATSPAAGNFKYNFTIMFQGETASAGDIYGCYVNQSNCYDDGLAGCKQIFVNTTLGAPIIGGNVTATHILDENDIVNSTLGGTTDNWIPWRIDKCGHYDSGMNVIQENTTVNWRIHVHPINWTIGDIANSVNSKIAPNMFMQNTIKGDNQGDIAYSVAKYGGSKVELYCHDGIDNPEDSDILIDGDDPDCFGITYSWVPKQDFLDPNLYYSPSGSHGTLANEIPEGDIGSNVTNFDAGFGETTVQYTMHQMPNGTLKMRFRHWALDKTATIFVSGLPNITSVNKYFPGTGETKGEMIYFLDKNGDPRDQDSLDSTETYTNKVALRSYLSGGTEITNLDTIINVTFDQNAVNMSEGYVLTININYVEASTVYEEIIYATIYFDNTTYPGGKWNSSNEREDTIVIDGLTWEPCGDTKNADFDLLNCNGHEINCFEQMSYDCYDPDCDMKTGPPAWNDYTSTSTTGLCAYNNESETNAMCFDGYNNDWRTEDVTWGHANSGLKDIDCRDSDCDTVSNGIVQCEYGIELNCTDSFNNDMYQKQDCDIQVGGTIDDVEYDCSVYCRNAYYSTESGAQCDDNIDNDWDKYYTTTGGATGYALNSTDGSGMDCAWGTGADEDCNLEIMGSGFRCELKHELTCTDGFNNDYDSGQPNPGWTTSAYASWFGTPFASSADFNDYDCQNEPQVAPNEDYYPLWCFDGIDNDMDAYYRSGDNFIANSSTGSDCSDPDCLGVVNPTNSSEVCLKYEFNATDAFFINLPEIDYYCKNNIDDDADGPKDCYDSDCNKQFSFCYACPDNEMDDWDSCADNFDNDYGEGTDESDPDCLYQLATYNHQFYLPLENTTYLCTDGYDNDQTNGADCSDPSCNGIAYCGAENCNDNIDNDGDGLVDCQDITDCNSICKIGTDMSGNYRPPATLSGTYGDVQLEWTYRVRLGENFTINLIKPVNYADANLYIGRLTGDALPVNQGLQNELFSVTGPEASNFETQSYVIDGTGTKGQLEILDQVPAGGFNLGGFDITVNIPTNETLASESFEYYHSIDGGVTTGNILNFRILDNITPTVNGVATSPTNGKIVYGEGLWVAVNASDPENGDYEDGTINNCLYNMSSATFFASGVDSSDCKFTINNLIDDGVYTLNVWAEDDTGNLAPVNTTTHNIDIVPKYLTNSFVLTDRWYRPVDAIDVEAQFYTDDAENITSCDVYYQLNTGATQYAGSVSANNTGDRLVCSGSISLPFIPNIYGMWINVTDSEGDMASSDKETFYICNAIANKGIGTYGEEWDCKFSDMNNDGTIDYCKISTNHPPKISLVSPEDLSAGTSTSPELLVLVTDQDNDLLNVYFYDQYDNLIGSNLGLSNGSIASYVWAGLNALTDYSWYVNVTDGINTTSLSVQKFQTGKGAVEVVAGGPAKGFAPTKKKSFVVDRNEIKPIINRSIISTEVIDVLNDGDVDLDIEVQIDPTINKFVIVEENRFGLRSGQSKTYYVKVFVPQDVEPGIYIGYITFYSEGIEQHVRMTLIVTHYPELVSARADEREHRRELFMYAISIIAILALILAVIEHLRENHRSK